MRQGQLADYSARRPWSAGEIRSLRDMYLDGKPVDEIADALGRSRKAVAAKITALAIERPEDKAQERGPKPGRVCGGVVADESWESWRRKKHGGRLPKTTVEWPEYRPDLPSVAFEEDVPLGSYR